MKRQPLTDKELAFLLSAADWLKPTKHAHPMMQVKMLSRLAALGLLSTTIKTKRKKK
jgi:hypothetical protein